MRRFQRQAIIIVVTASAVLPAACARHTAPALNEPLIRTGPKATIEAKEPPKSSLDEYIGKVRQISAQARPAPKPALASVETTYPEIVAALAKVAVSSTPETHREAAEAYRRIGLLDRAYDHLTKALRLAPRDAGAYEGLARIWRDWGFAHFGLGDAHRAVYYAPQAPSAQNTLGTVLQALGHTDAARKAYRRALALDPEAAYALNNLCYLSLVEKKTTQAIEECRGALEIDPAFVAAQNNLALAYMAEGREAPSAGSRLNAGKD